MASVALPLTFSRTRSATSWTAAVGRTPRNRPFHPTEATIGQAPMPCFCGLCGLCGAPELVGIFSLIGAGAARTEATESTEAGPKRGIASGFCGASVGVSGGSIHAEAVNESMVKSERGDLGLRGRTAWTPGGPESRYGR
jgi:hypothetical protein